VTASLSGGLQIESAALAGVACTITAQSIDCAAANLAARAQTELSVVVTGLATGAEQATVTATATEDERNAEDNSLVLAVQILPTPAPEEQGGGGAISPLWLVVGGLALLRRRRRPIR
jgi:MYXO-CTERM domain-containing protein